MDGHGFRWFAEGMEPRRDDSEDRRIERLASVLEGLFGYLELNGILWHLRRHADDNAGARLMWLAALSARHRWPSDEEMGVDAMKPWQLLPPNPQDAADYRAEDYGFGPSGLPAGHVPMNEVVDFDND